MSRLSSALKTESAKRLMLNTSMLYLLTFSGYFLGLVTLPYQARVLGPEIFGMVSFAMAFGLYFQLLIDFGFTLSATEQVAKHRHDKNKVSAILSAVTWSKVFLAGVSAIALALLCLFVEPFKQDPLLYILFFSSYVLASFVPDYIYRGMENMKAITVRTVTMRAISVLLIFVFLRDQSDYYVVPILLTLGNLAALVFVAWDMWRKGMVFSRVSFGELKGTLKQSSMFFYSRVATNIYTATNTFVLGIIYGPATHIVGYFTSADKLTSAAKYGMSPLIDSIYPHMVRERNFGLIKKVLLLFMPLIIAGSVIVGIFAYDICALLFGEEFRGAGEYLRLLIPIACLAFPSMLFGFPVLSPMGLSKYANASNIFGAAMQVVQLTILFLSGHLTVVAICIATIITESATLSFRLVVVWRYRHLMKAESGVG